jgi:hypothetical protein
MVCLLALLQTGRVGPPQIVWSLLPYCVPQMVSNQGSAEGTMQHRVGTSPFPSLLFTTKNAAGSAGSLENDTQDVNRAMRMAHAAIGSDIRSA